jgi:hyperosmotically inducible periplasmic protein
MKTHLTLGTFALAALLTTGVAYADERPDSDTDRSHPGTFVKDSAITTKVKANLAADHASNLAKIHVDTDKNGVVWLSGTVESAAIASRAVAIAEKTDGVRSVHNDIKVAAED